MKKLWKRVLICGVLTAIVWSIGLITDRQQLHEQLIRFHVVANSDTEADQMVKLQVRDAVLDSLQKDLKKIADIDEARRYLQTNLPKIQSVANKTLQSLGMDMEATVSLCKEAFDARVYDTFALPAGVYEALRITIGQGNGRNWWCVTFPGLCIPATSQGFADTAVEAGMSSSLCNALICDGEYNIRFFFLDVLGKAENIFFRK